MDRKLALARRILTRLHQHGHEAYFAGGCVRDRLRGVTPKDYDIATAALPHQVQALFPRTVAIGAQFGVILVIEGGTPFEVATFRTEAGYVDGRRPTVVDFSSVEEDAGRRDFTVNGLYFDIVNDRLLDFVGGQEDLKRKIIRTIGDPEERFREDHLRLMRAVRFAVQLGFEIEGQTREALTDYGPLIESVSAERIRDELVKTLTSPDPAGGIRLLDETGILDYILPELKRMKGVEQPSEYHPEGDVWVHTLMLLELLPSEEPELIIGALLHDIAKPDTFERAADRIRFHGHDTIGAEMSRGILRRLAFSNDEIKLICELVAQHLRFKDAKNMRVSTLKRFLSLPRFDLHLKLHWADCSASHGKLEAYEYCKEKWEAFRREPPPPAKLVTGQDLIKMGFSPGPRFKEILRAVEDGILEGRIRTREEGLKLVKEQFAKEEA